MTELDDHLSAFGLLFGFLLLLVIVLYQPIDFLLFVLPFLLIPLLLAMPLLLLLNLKHGLIAPRHHLLHSLLLILLNLELVHIESMSPLLATRPLQV